MDPFTIVRTAYELAVTITPTVLAVVDSAKEYVNPALALEWLIHQLALSIYSGGLLYWLLNNIWWFLLRSVLPRCTLGLSSAATAHSILRYSLPGYAATCDWYSRRIWSTVVGCCTINTSHHKLRQRFDTAIRESISAAERPYPPASHPHRRAAGLRNLGNVATIQAITRCGLEPYEVSFGTRDQGLPGDRQYYDVKDLNVPSRSDAIQPNSCIRLIDVDYYADMWSWLWYFRPVVIYTFTPTTTVQHEGTDTIWRILPSGKLCMNILGGGEYVHDLWDYHTDILCCDYFLGTAVYDVSHHLLDPTDPTRRVISFIPRTWTWGPFARFLSGRRLRRQNLGNNGAWRIDTFTGGVKLTSVSVDEGPCVNLPTDHIETLVVKQKIKPLDQGAVERYLRQLPSQNLAEFKTKAQPGDAAPEYPEYYSSILPSTHCAILTDWLTRYVQVNTCTFTPEKPGDKAKHYQTLSPLSSDDGKGFARIISPGLTEDLPGVPVESLNNDQACINGRIIKVRNNKRPSPAQRMATYQVEFLQQLVPSHVAGTGYPIDPDEVNRRQNEPRQRVRYEEWVNWPLHVRCAVKSFMKHEVYPSFNDPRNISTVPTDHQVRLSQYTMQFSQYLKEKRSESEQMFEWYMPGASPIALAQRVQDFVRRYDRVLTVDYSRLDGSISEYLRHFESACYLRYFGDNPELVNLLENEYEPRARTKHGIRYKPGFSRLSGSPLTTDGNTLICAFVSYCINRDTNMDSTAAFQNIGCIYGDDGILPPTDPQRAARVASNFGLVLKVDVIPCGLPLKFLGRLFIDPWATLATCQDPKRTLPKLHLTCTNDANVPLAVAARHRADAYLVIDQHTPIISNWCRRMQRRYPTLRDKVRDKYAMYLTLDRPYLMDSGTWPQVDEDDVPMLMAIMANDIGVDTARIAELCEALDNDEIPDAELPKLPWTTEVKLSVQVDGELRHPRGSKISENTDKSSKQRKQNRRPRPTQPPHDNTVPQPPKPSCKRQPQPPRPRPANNQPNHATRKNNGRNVPRLREQAPNDRGNALALPREAPGGNDHATSAPPSHGGFVQAKSSAARRAQTFFAKKQQRRANDEQQRPTTSSRATPQGGPSRC